MSEAAGRNIWDLLQGKPAGAPSSRNRDARTTQAVDAAAHSDTISSKVNRSHSDIHRQWQVSFKNLRDKVKSGATSVVGDSHPENVDTQRSSPVLWRIRKQLKLSSKTVSVDESSLDAINSSQSALRTCSVGSVCLKQQHCHTLPTSPALSSSEQSLVLHTRPSEKNIFSSMCPSDNVQPVTAKAAVIANTNEILSSSSSPSVTESGSYPASVASDVLKPGDESAGDDSDAGDSLPQQGSPLPADVTSHPVPVTLFCAPTCTISAPVPVALFRAQSCNSATVPENSLDIIQGVPHTENSPGVSLNSYSGGSQRDVSVSTGKIPGSITVQSDPSVSVSYGGIPVQHDSSELAVAVEEEANDDRSDNNVSKCPETDDIMSTSYIHCSSGVALSSGTAASGSKASVKKCYQSVSSIHLQDSLTSEPSMDSISNSQLLPSTSELETMHSVEKSREVNNIANGSDVTNAAILDLQQHFPEAKISQTQEQNDLSHVSDGDWLDDEDLCSEKLPVTNKLPGIELADISNGPDEQISDEQIVSQILAAELPPDQVPISHDRQHEMLSPVVSGQNSASQSLIDVLTMNDANVTNDTLIGSTEMGLPLHQIQQRGDPGLTVPSGTIDSWMYDDTELQDMLCTLLNSCHVNSTDAAAADDDDDVDTDDDASSCSSSSTEVYAEDTRPDDDVSAGHDSDSDGTVSPLSVVLDGDGLDLMDSAPGGFQTIYSSLVDPAQLDRELCSSGSTELTNRLSVDLLLDKERNCSDVKALDAGLVKYPPSSTLCTKVEECVADKDDGLNTDDNDADGENGNVKKPVSCQCSKKHGSKKSCRSCLRMPEKTLACRSPPLGKCSTATRRHDSDTAESAEIRDVSPLVSGLSQGPCDKRAHRKHSRKRKQSKNKDENKSKSLSEMESCKKPAMKMESCTLRIQSTSQTKESIKRSSSLLSKGQTHSMLIGQQNQQTVFSLEDNRSGSTRMVILNKTMCLPMMTIGKKSGPDRKLEQAIDQWKLNCGRVSSDIQDEERGGGTFDTQQPTDDGNGGKGQNKDDPEGIRETNEWKSFMKRKKKSKTKMKQKKKVLNFKDSTEGCQVQTNVTVKGSDSISQENRSKSSDNKADNVADVKDSSHTSGRRRGRPRKKCLLLAQLENSEGYVANSVAPDSRTRSRSISEKSENVSHGMVLDRDSSISGGSRRRGRPRKKCLLLAQLENSQGYMAASRNRSSDNNIGDLSVFDYDSSSRSSSGRGWRPKKKSLPTDASLPKASGSISQENKTRSVGEKSSNVGDDGTGVSRRRGRPRKKCLLLAQLENSEGYVAQSISHDSRTRNRSMSEKSENFSDERTVDHDSSGSDRPRKRCLLLAQLENSEGFVVNKSQQVSEEHSQEDYNSLLWTDSSSLSREERALQRALMQIQEMEMRNLLSETRTARPKSKSPAKSPTSSWVKTRQNDSSDARPVQATSLSNNKYDADKQQKELMSKTTSDKIQQPVLKGRKRKSMTSAWGQQALKFYVRRYRQRSSCLRQRHDIAQKPARLTKRGGCKSTAAPLSTQLPTLQGTVPAADDASTAEAVALFESSSGRKSSWKSVITATNESTALVECSLPTLISSVVNRDDVIGDDRMREPIVMKITAGGCKSRQKSLPGATSSYTTKPVASLDYDRTDTSQPAAEESKHRDSAGRVVAGDKCLSDPATGGRKSRQRFTLATTVTRTTETIASVECNSHNLPAVTKENNQDVIGDECMNEPVINRTAVAATDEDVTEDECVNVPVAGLVKDADIVGDSIATSAHETDSLVLEQSVTKPAASAIKDEDGDDTETEDEYLVDVETCDEPTIDDSITEDSAAAAAAADSNVGDETDSTMIDAEEQFARELAATETDEDVGQTQLIDDHDVAISDRSTRDSIVTTCTDVVTDVSLSDMSAVCASSTVTTATATTDGTTTTADAATTKHSSAATVMEKADLEQHVGGLPDLSAVNVSHSTSTTTTTATTNTDATTTVDTATAATVWEDESAMHLKYGITTSTTTAMQSDMSALYVNHSSAAATTTATPSTTTMMTTKMVTLVDSQPAQEMSRNMQDRVVEMMSLQPVTETRYIPMPLSSAAAAASSSLKSVTGDQLALQIPAEVRKICVDHSAGETVLHKAARLGYLDVVRWCCMTRGYVADINARNNADYTALHESCAAGHSEVASSLIQFGADVHAISQLDGARPIHDAVEANSISTVRVLLCAGADVSMQKYSGETVLHLVKSLEMKRFIEGYLADLNGSLLHDESQFRWNFQTSLSGEETCDLLYGAPADDSEAGDRLDQLTVECCHRSFPSIYYLQLDSRTESARCLLLADVVSTLGVTRHKFASTHRNVVIHRIAWSDFELQTMFADFKSIRRRVEQMTMHDDHDNLRRDRDDNQHRDISDDHRDEHHSVESLSGSDFSDDDSIEVVMVSVELFAILGIEVIPLN